MFCEKCGFEVGSDFSFCPNCGASLNVNTFDAPDSDDVSEPVNPSPDDSSIFDIFEEVSPETSDESEKTIIAENVNKDNRSDTSDIEPEPKENLQQNKHTDTSNDRKTDSGQGDDTITKETNEESFEEKYALILDLMRQAKDGLDMGNANAVLYNARTCNELFIKELCAAYSITNDTQTTTAYSMIEALSTKKIISPGEKDLFHKIRVLGNVGHTVEGISDYDRAKRIYESVTEAIEIYKRLLSDAAGEDVRAKYNVPMDNPDYYTKDRAYFGKWVNCYSRSDLVSIPDYNKLLRKTDSSDTYEAIEAMLDIAVGFLPPRQINWQKDLGLINYEVYSYQGKEYNKECCYDARYYHWINAAAELACRVFKECEDYQKKVPLKYIANTLLEAKKHYFYVKYDGTYKRVASVSHYYDNQRRERVYVPEYVSDRETEMEMFGDHPVPPQDVCTAFLKEILSRYPDKTILCPVHNENSIKHILFMDYCDKALINIKRERDGNHQLYNVTEDNAVYTTDIGKTITQEFLQKFCDDPVCKKYAYITNHYIEKNYPVEPEWVSWFEEIPKEERTNQNDSQNMASGDHFSGQASSGPQNVSSGSYFSGNTQRPRKESFWTKAERALAIHNMSEVVMAILSVLIPFVCPIILLTSKKFPFKGKIAIVVLLLLLIPTVFAAGIYSQGLKADQTEYSNQFAAELQNVLEGDWDGGSGYSIHFTDDGYFTQSYTSPYETYTWDGRYKITCNGDDVVIKYEVDGDLSEFTFHPSEDAYLLTDLSEGFAPLTVDDRGYVKVVDSN